jgi:hypothetical protein
MLRVQKVRDGSRKRGTRRVRYPDFPQLWLRRQRTLVSIVVHSWLAEAPKSKNSVDTGHRIPLKGQSIPGTSEENWKTKKQR